MDANELQWITYLSLAALAIVTYLYLRQRNQINQRVQTHLPQDDLYSVTAKPAGFLNKSFPGTGPNLPTFSPQEGFQRRNPGEMNASHRIPRDTRDFSGFGDGAGSRFNRVPADFGQTKAADKSFDDYRKYVPYEPSQEISTSKLGFKQDQNDRNKPNWSKPETSLTQISTQLDAYDANRDILYAQTQPQVEEDVPTTGDRWNNTRTLDAADLENEYKVFKDFKLREGRGFHEEVKRDESPLRANNKRLTGLDRVGHSPDSPFKMFESPAVGTNSKKKQGVNQTKQQQNLLSKKDSFTRTQEALNQKTKPPGRTVVPHNQRSAKVLAEQKNERKTRLNQVFIDNNSEDEMHVEEQRDLTIKNKRPATNTRSFDNYGKEQSNKKVLKTNDQQAKTKPFERKDIPIKNYQIDVYSKKEQKPALNKQSSVDLSYMSEYSANPSLKRYVQMKTRQDETTKASKPSTPITNTKGMNVEKSPRQAASPRVEKGSYRAPSSLARKEDTQAGSKKIASNGSHKTSTSESKQEKSPLQKSDVDDNKSPFSNSNGNKLSSLPKDTSIKPEGAKISSIIGGSSLFTQPKPSETTPIGDVETKAPKLNETEKAPAQAPMGQGNAFSLFKTIRSGGSGPPVKESVDQPQVEAAPAQKNEEPQESKKQSTLFSNTATSDKEVEDEKPAKSLFANSSGGLFGNLTQTSTSAENKPEGTGLFGKSFGNKETKDTESKPASSSLGLGAATKSSDKEEEKPKTGLFGSLVTPAGGSGSGSLFGNLNTEPKKEPNQPAFSGLFGNANKDADNQKEAPKKDDPLAAYSKQPEGVDEAKPKGLFANSNSSFTSLFKNPSSNQDNSGSGKVGGSLFGGLTSGKSTGGGLFSNLNNANQPKE